eukprot:COSAG02_NODE_339_length_24201_cov_45.538462_2_plen_82_part_00
MAAWAQCVVCEFPPAPPPPRLAPCVPCALRALCCVGGTGGCSVAPLMTEVMGGVRLAQNLLPPPGLFAVLTCCSPVLTHPH